MWEWVTFHKYINTTSGRYNYLMEILASVMESSSYSRSKYILLRMNSIRRSYNNSRGARIVMTNSDKASKDLLHSLEGVGIEFLLNKCIACRMVVK